ncbi:MAG: hypothetical protein V1686_01265 [Patescibacteria group bacterium]
MFKDLLEKLKELNLPKGKFAIFGSGPMGPKGLRDPRDLDIIVTEDIFSDFKKRPDFKLGQKKSDNEYLEKDGIEIYTNWNLEDWDINKLINEAEIIDNLPFVRIEEVLRWKRAYNREKDIKDIELIENYLNRK